MSKMFYFLRAEEDKMRLSTKMIVDALVNTFKAREHDNWKLALRTVDAIRIAATRGPVFNKSTGLGFSADLLNVVLGNDMDECLYSLYNQLDGLLLVYNL